MSLDGFATPGGPGGGKCKSQEVIYGDLETDNLLHIKAFGNSWGGAFHLCASISILIADKNYI